jgi:hypothetical protein
LSVAAAGSAVCGLSDEVTRRTSPPLTATATRPSCAAASLPYRWRISTTVPSPTLVCARVSRLSTAALRSENSPTLFFRKARATASASPLSPPASLPLAGVTEAGVPSLFQRVTRLSSRTRERWPAVGAALPPRLSTKS